MCVYYIAVWMCVITYVLCMVLYVCVCGCLCVLLYMCIYVNVHVYVCICVCAESFLPQSVKPSHFNSQKKSRSNNIRIQPMILTGPKQPSKITVFFCFRVLYFYLSPCSPIHSEENLHTRSKYHVIYVNRICTQVAEALRPHLLSVKVKNSQLHRDVVCCALLVICRLIFMFQLNKQLARLSIVSCFALKTQLANPVRKQVKSGGSDGLIEAKQLCLNSFSVTFSLITGDPP